MYHLTYDLNSAYPDFRVFKYHEENFVAHLSGCFRLTSLKYLAV